MTQKDLQSLQENYQQIEEGLLKRMGNRYTTAKKAIMGTSDFGPKMRLIDKYVGDMVNDMVKMKMINPDGFSSLAHDLREEISKCVKRFE